MSVNFRLAEPGDVTALVRLLEVYTEETFGGQWRGTLEQLKQDAFGTHVSIAVAVTNRRVVGFVAWLPSYDLHHCCVCMEVADIYVVKAHRGKGVAVGLLATAAAAGWHDGARFMSGGAVPTGSGIRLFARAAMRHGDKFHLSGRAFRILADADATSPRTLLHGVAPKGANFEPGTDGG